MKVPQSPPDFDQTLRELLAADADAILRLASVRSIDDRYLHWDELRRRRPPDGLSLESWWLALALRRRAALRPIDGLVDAEGRPFAFNLPDEVLRLNEEVVRRASGQIAASDLVTNPSTRDRYVVSSLMEEAITSSQLEGAVTTRRVAKDLLRSGRAPRDLSEQMIVNNYRAMRRISELRDRQLSPDLVLELHEIVTDRTLDNPDAAGRLQTPDDVRVAVWSTDEEVLHEPPSARELPERLSRLCSFANGGHAEYVPPLLRAIIVHFMVGYDHYFEDGNGRTARALFYWCMLREGFWLSEFITISKVLKRAPAQYGRAYLYTETDGGDLTYFLLHQLRSLVTALDELDEHLAGQVVRLRSARRDLGELADRLNHRQRAVVEHALENPGFVYSADSHARSHRVTAPTAHSDLTGLADLGILIRGKRGRRFVWTAPADLGERLREVPDESSNA